MTSKEEYEEAKREKLRYAPNSLKGIDFKIFEFKDGIGPVKKSYDLFNDGTVILIKTPGHSLGHTSIMVKVNEKYIIIAGDAAYTNDSLTKRIIPGLTANKKLAYQSIDYLIESEKDPNCLGVFANHNPCVGEISLFLNENTKNEKSCGAVIYRKVNNAYEFLLLKMGLGHTSLCKGHVEEGETEEETALREIKEETSLNVKLDTSFKEKCVYSPKEGVLKDVYFFLATPIDSSSSTSDLHDDEVTSSYWKNYEEAQKELTYFQDREVLRKAYNYLKKGDK